MFIMIMFVIAQHLSRNTSPMLKAERQQRILERMQQSQSAVTVRELAQEFETSPITIRRDLLELGERGLLARTAAQ